MPDFVMHLIPDNPEAGNFIRMRRGELIIVKLQISLWSNTGERRVLIYDEHKKKVWQMTAATQQLVDRFGDRLRFYAEAWMEGNQLVIGKDVRDRTW
jgi:hypothetical protein